MFGFGGKKTIDLSPQEVQAGLNEGRIILVDVREPAEFAAERIEGAVNYPLSCLDPKALPREDGKTTVLSCQAGSRSARAVEACRGAGVEIDSQLKGGIGAWKSAGLATVR